MASDPAVLDELKAFREMMTNSMRDLNLRFDSLAIESRELREQITEQGRTIEEMKRDNEGLREQVNEQEKVLHSQGEILKKQQQYLEKLDMRERGRNIILLGIEEGEEGTDEQKVKELVSMLKSDVMITNITRIGEKASRKIRPILACLDNRKVRDEIVTAARASTNTAFNKIKIKKDLHPVVRREWKRLYEVKEKEEKKSENAEKVVAIDMKKRAVTCDGQIIDAWSSPF